jgi:hypothetical protein
MDFYPVSLIAFLATENTQQAHHSMTDHSGAATVDCARAQNKLWGKILPRVNIRTPRFLVVTPTRKAFCLLSAV